MMTADNASTTLQDTDNGTESAKNVQALNEVLRWKLTSVPMDNVTEPFQP